MSNINITVTDSLVCPNCGTPELIPHTANPDGSYKKGALWAIRPYKVDNWSQCLVCSGLLDGETFERTDKPSEECTGGWFPPPWE